MWRVELEPSKSSFILFSRCPTHRRLKISLQLHGIEIPQVKHARFLGIIFDEKLDWTQQINSLVGRTSSRIHLLRNIAAKSRWRHPQETLRFFDALVKSVVDYAGPCFLTMKISLWEKLEKVHSRAIKSFAGVPRFVGYSTICNHLFVPRWKTSIEEAATKRIGGILASSPFEEEMKSNALIVANPIYESPVAKCLRQI